MFSFVLHLIFFGRCRRLLSFAVLRYPLDPLVYFVRFLLPVTLEMCLFPEGSVLTMAPRTKVRYFSFRLLRSPLAASRRLFSSLMTRATVPSRVRLCIFTETFPVVSSGPLLCQQWFSFLRKRRSSSFRGRVGRVGLVVRPPLGRSRTLLTKVSFRCSVGGHLFALSVASG